jgi:hypothetical protein
MELKTFVAETIAEIVEGMNDANKKLSKSGAVVSPRYYADSKGSPRYDHSDKWKPSVEKVEFDIALTPIDGKGSTEGIGVAIARIGLGKKNQKEQTNSNVSRVQFSVPILYPLNKRKSEK